MVQINISALKPGQHHFVLEPEASDLDLDPGRFSNVEVKAQLDVYTDRILVSLAARAEVALECDRTLQPFQQEIGGKYYLLFAPADIVAAAEEDQDVRILSPSDQEIDLTEAIRDTLLLAVPARAIAPGAEQLEIPTQFGAPVGEEAMDPRWEALRALRSRDEDS